MQTRSPNTTLQGALQALANAAARANPVSRKIRIPFARRHHSRCAKRHHRKRMPPCRAVTNRLGRPFAESAGRARGGCEKKMEFVPRESGFFFDVEPLIPGSHELNTRFFVFRGTRARRNTGV